MKPLRFDPTASVWTRSVTVGLMAGIGFGGFDVLIIGIAIFSGRYQHCGRSAGTGTCDYWVLAVTYPLGATIMGAIGGAVPPWCRRRWLAIPLGIIAAIPWFIGITLADVQALAHWRRSDTILVLACSAVIGTGIGIGTSRGLARRRT